LWGGLLAATAVATVARAVGALTGSGAFAAIGVGTLAVAAGWEWGTVLVVFFVSSTALSRLGLSAKSRATRGRLEKTGPRDWRQVLANGGVFAVASVISVTSGHSWPALAALGALATANGDTWATELGMLWGRAPRSIISWKPVPRGTSGGVSIPGTIAGIAGVLLIAVSASMLHIHRDSTDVILIAGVAGLVADSIMGATIQSQRWCDQCHELTERTVHSCGARTTHRRGVRWIDNDGVNALATVVGAAVAAGIVIA
jgi:uncharacterized protein (TIGR00297 family)